MIDTPIEIKYYKALDTVSNVILNADIDVAMEILEDLESYKISRPCQKHLGHAINAIGRLGFTLRFYDEFYDTEGLPEDFCLQLETVGRELVDVVIYSQWLPQVAFVKSFEVWEILEETLEVFPFEIKKVMGFKKGFKSFFVVTKQGMSEMMAAVVLNSLIAKGT